MWQSDCSGRDVEEGNVFSVYWFFNSTCEEDESRLGLTTRWNCEPLFDILPAFS